MSRNLLFAAGYLPPLIFGVLLGVARAETVIGQNDQLIHDRARMGTGVQVEAILQKTPEMKGARSSLGSTPLHLAATNPDISALKVLLAAGAEVNARDIDGNTPLHMAAYTNLYEHARLLLEAGADVNATSSGGRTPIALARKTRADNVAGLLALWILKGCQARAAERCIEAEPNDLEKLLD